MLTFPVESRRVPITRRLSRTISHVRSLFYGLAFQPEPPDRTSRAVDLAGNTSSLLGMINAPAASTEECYERCSAASFRPRAPIRPPNAARRLPGQPNDAHPAIRTDCQALPASSSNPIIAASGRSFIASIEDIVQLDRLEEFASSKVSPRKR